MTRRRWFLMHTLAPLDEHAVRRFNDTGEGKRPYEHRVEALLWLLVGRPSSSRGCWSAARVKAKEQT